MCYNNAVRNYKNHIPITEHMYAELMMNKKRTGMGAIALYGHMHRTGLLKPGHKITVKRIESWFTRIAKKANPDDWSAVLAAYRKLPDADAHHAAARCSEQRVPVSDDLQARLNKVFKERTNQF